MIYKWSFNAFCLVRELRMIELRHTDRHENDALKAKLSVELTTGAESDSCDRSKCAGYGGNYLWNGALFPIYLVKSIFTDFEISGRRRHLK